MTIPNLPTDNLYKFVALTGVVLLILSLLYPESQRTTIRDEITLYNGEVRKLNFERDKSKRKLKDIKEQVKELDKKTNCKCNSIVNDSIISRTKILEGPDELVKLSLEIDRLVEEYVSINRELNMKVAEIDAKLELINNKNQDLEELNEATSLFIPFSFLLSIAGFFLWYDNTQKYQDRVLKEQANQFLQSDFCQSCGMRLSNQKNYHLYSADEKKSIYCNSCFKDGEFLEPDISLEQMREKVKTRLKELGYNRFLIYIFIRDLGRLERWRTKFRWK